MITDKEQLRRAIESQRQRVDYLNGRWGPNGWGRKASRRKKRETAEYILQVLRDKEQAMKGRREDEQSTEAQT